MTVLKRAEGLFRSSNLNSKRGNSASRQATQFNLDKFSSVGKHPFGSIRCLNKSSSAGFGNKTSDGVNSQTGSTSTSKIGYKGDVKPLLDLVNESGHRPLQSSFGFVASAELAPAPYTSVDEIGKKGLQPVLKGRTMVKQSNMSVILPPRQEGACRGKRNKRVKGRHAHGMTKFNARTAKLLKIDRARTSREMAAREVVIDPLTQRTLFKAKFGDDGDPNAIFPLAPIDPVEQQGYRPERLKPAEHYTIDPMGWNGEQAKVGEDREFENQKEDVVDQPGVSVSNNVIARAAVENYLWSTATHRSIDESPDAPIPRPPNEKYRAPGYVL